MEPVQIGLFLSVFSGVCTAFWTVLTWRENQDKIKETQRSRNAALYVNPFLLVAEELQNGLYEYLVGEETKISEKKDAEAYAGFSARALEILYVIVTYFGWAFVIYRYGPYTSDRKVIELTRKIAETFADADESYEDDAFYFSLSEQKALGLTFIQTFNPGNFGNFNPGHLSQEGFSAFPAFEATSLYEFEELIKSQRTERSALYINIRDVLHSINESNITENLSERKRLLLIQSYLVDLLDYLEEKEGFSVSIKKRRKVQSDQGALLFMVKESSSCRILHHTTGRIRLQIADLYRNESRATQLQSLVQPLAEVKTVRVNPTAASLIIDYDPDVSKGSFEQKILQIVANR